MKVSTCLPAAARTRRFNEAGVGPKGNPPHRFLGAKHRRWIAGICRSAGLRAGFLLLLFAATNPAIGRAGAGPITYAYDELGRLVGAVDGTGAGVQYTYDAVGNLTNITPKSASTLSVFTCTPSNGPKGMTVIIYGDGFSTTPSENTVTFSGASATVSASTSPR